MERGSLERESVSLGVVRTPVGSVAGPHGHGETLDDAIRSNQQKGHK